MPQRVTIHRPEVKEPVTLSLMDVRLSGITDPYFKIKRATEIIKDSYSKIDPSTGSPRPITHFEIPNGIYDLSIPPGIDIPKWASVIYFDGLKDLTIDGQGSIFRFHDIHNAIRLIRCERVLIKNLSIDYTMPLALAGTITHDPDPRIGTVFQVNDANQTFPIDSPPTITVISEFDIESRAWITSRPFRIEGYYPGESSTQDLIRYIGIYKGIPTYRLPFASARFFAEGTPAIGIVRHNDLIAFSGVYLSKDISVENVHVYASPGVGFGFNGMRTGLHIRDSSVSRRSPDRMISSSADAMYINQNEGNILIENNTIESQGDDGINIHGFYEQIQGIDRSRNSISIGGYTLYKPGDTLVFYELGTYKELGRSTIMSNSIESVTCTSGCRYELELIDPIPRDVVLGSYFVDINLASTHFVFRNNHFKNMYANGIRVQTQFGLIQNNYFDRIGRSGIRIMADMDYSHEGPGASNLVIDNNLMTNVNFAAVNSWNAIGAPIMVYIPKRTLSDDPMQAIPHKNLLITKNIFSSAQGLFMYLQSITDAEVYDNKMTGRSVNSDPLIQGVIMTTAVKNLRFHDNYLENELINAAFDLPLQSDQACHLTLIR